MSKGYASLASSTLSRGTTFYKPAQQKPERVTLESPALDVMTDLKRITGVTVDPMVPIDAARERMIQHHIRLLFVVDAWDTTLGLVTATDILGERPIQIIQARGVTRRDILVRDIMTPQEKLEVLTMSDVQYAKVGNIVATLKACGRQHALVAEKADGGTQRIRGIFSSTQLARQLGIVIQTNEVARTFAEVEAQLAR